MSYFSTNQLRASVSDHTGNGHPAHKESIMWCITYGGERMVCRVFILRKEMVQMSSCRITVKITNLITCTRYTRELSANAQKFSHSNYQFLIVLGGLVVIILSLRQVPRSRIGIMIEEDQFYIYF